MIITETDLMMDERGQPVVSAAGDSLMVSGDRLFSAGYQKRGGDNRRGMFLGCGLWVVYVGFYAKNP